MSKKKHIISYIVISAVMVLTTVLLCINFIVTIKNCSSYFDGQALLYSLELTGKNAKQVGTNADTSTEKIRKISASLKGVTGFERLDSLGEKLVKEYNADCLQFVSEGHAVYRYGKGVGSSTSPEMISMMSKKEFSSSHIFTDESLGVKCIAMYGPVFDNSEIDGVIAYFNAEGIFQTELKDDMLKFYCLAETDGSIIELNNAKGFQTDVSHNIYTYLTNINRTKAPIKDLEANCKNNIPGSYNLRSGNTDYIISCTNVSCLSSSYNVFCVYTLKDLTDAQYPLYGQLFGICVALLITGIIILIMYIISNYKSVVEMNALDEVDPLIGCNSYAKFSRIATELLATNRHSTYALVYFDINKFTYLRENFGSEMCDDILRQVSTIIDKMLSDNETYGHIMDDRFGALMLCSNMEEFTNRIKIISALLANYQKAKENNFKLSLAIGVYKIERAKNYSLREMIDRASVAEKIHKQNNTETFVMYDSSIRAAYVKEAEIESRMEYALKNNEFRVFYQPKYNIHNDCIDGSEALVRWYDPNTNSYTSPIDFIPLFEVNGFISKLDRYVFNQVCMLLSELTERGEKTAPVSINVSRVSATQFDFLSYYINTKRQYNIPDNLLTLEFTESFAYENYGTLNSIVVELHKNGFHCSIDDFGSGYSSFEILKSLPMDEMKLDKMFLTPSSDREKDIILLKSSVALGKSFNMKVTQEGVEDLEQLKELESYGCDVIQGYYYSKPIPASDFIEFIAGDTSLNGVIRNIIDGKNKENSFEEALK